MPPLQQWSMTSNLWNLIFITQSLVSPGTGIMVPFHREQKTRGTELWGTGGEKVQENLFLTLPCSQRKGVRSESGEGVLWSEKDTEKQAGKTHRVTVCSCLLIYHPSSPLVLLCECPISMVVFLDKVKAYSISCELLSTFQMLDNQCLWWENMEELYWDRAFHPGSSLLSFWCYNEGPFFLSWNTVPEAVPFKLCRYNGNFCYTLQ